MQNDTALLVMDVQNATMAILQDTTAFVNAITKSIENARSKNIPVIYVVVGYRKGYPEMSPDNKSFLLLKSDAMKLDSEESFAVYSPIAPQGDEILITKKRVSAFTGSDLEVVLRASGIKNIVLTGISTSGVVLSTLREAADKDYRITVLSDCCADRDEEVHRVLLTKVFPRQGDVMKSDEWIAILSKG
ncbi:MAG: isochorismatase [Sediminibacterium sp.]|nr:isochorismatase [Sediminibacterium sp.]